MRLSLKIAVFAALLPAVLWAEALLNVDFDNHPVGAYTRAMAAG